MYPRVLTATSLTSASAMCPNRAINCKQLAKIGQLCADTDRARRPADIERLKKMVASNGRLSTIVNTVLAVVALLLMIMIGIMTHERQVANANNAPTEAAAESGANKVVDRNYW